MQSIRVSNAAAWLALECLVSNLPPNVAPYLMLNETKRIYGHYCRFSEDYFPETGGSSAECFWVDKIS